MNESSTPFLEGEKEEHLLELACHKTNKILLESCNWKFGGQEQPLLLTDTVNCIPFFFLNTRFL